MVQLPQAVTSAATADEMLVAIVRFTTRDHPFVAHVAQLALQATSLPELERAVTSLYRLGLEHQLSYIADLTNEVLYWTELQLDGAA